MEAYETPVMEVVEIEDELVTVDSCAGECYGLVDSVIRREESL